ncbi:hypothetical protein C9J85_16145 [Haloferax sp. wsp5]|nr:hypothetical protein C9J85_16145 [Haloferax sp. wsp5]
MLWVWEAGGHNVKSTATPDGRDRRGRPETTEPYSSGTSTPTRVRSPEKRVPLRPSPEHRHDRVVT